MNLNDSINELFKHGCTRITFGLNPEQGMFLGVEQHFPTADKGGMHATHEVGCESPVDGATKALDRVKHVWELHQPPSVLSLPKNGR